MVLRGCPGPDYRNPDPRGAITQVLHVYVEDVEGHHWTFAQHIRDAPPEEVRPAGA